jgi:BirA family biotin operon repressor/biotin-[acetyl-CoA-carboxylase] ligase
MTAPMKLIRLLADGRFHSGEALGALLGVSRGAVWKRLKSLEKYGLDLQAVRGRGYRLAAPLELLDARAIRAALPPAAPLLDTLEVLIETDSTSHHLLRNTAGPPPGGACFAEWQSAGRGRRGRHWVSPFGAALYGSIGWRFQSGPAALSGLSLAAGVAVIQALTACGIRDCRLKWPNDVQVYGRKLAGILIDMRGESGGPVDVVLGVGLNLRLPPISVGDIDQPWTDLHQIGAADISRNTLAGVLLGELLLMLRTFQTQGFAAFREAWRRYDALAGQDADLLLPDRAVHGRVVGIDDDGALLIRTGNGVQAYASGEISVRIAS